MAHRSVLWAVGLPLIFNDISEGGNEEAPATKVNAKGLATKGVKRPNAMNLAGEIDLQLGFGTQDSNGKGGNFVEFRLIRLRIPVHEAEAEGGHWCAVEGRAGDFNEAWRPCSDFRPLMGELSICD